MARRSNTAAKTPAEVDDMTDEELEAAMAAEAGAADEQPDDEQPDSAAETAAEPEAKAESEDEEAAEAADDSDKDEGDKEPETVPHARFHHERERRKAAEQAAERRERQLSQILEAMGKRDPAAQDEGQPKEDLPPDIDEDPAGYIQWQTRQIEALRSGLQQTHQQTQEQAYAEQVYRESSYDMAQYAQENPQAQEAYQFLANGVRQYLAENGITDKARQDAEIYQRQVNLAAVAKQHGARPGAYFEFLARQYGWEPQAQQPAANADGATDPKKVADAIDREESTRSKARSMKDTGAPVETGGLTVEMLDGMSDQEFNELLEKKFKGDFDAMERALLA